MMHSRQTRGFFISSLLVFFTIYFGLYFFCAPKRHFDYTRGIYDWSGVTRIEYADTLHIQKYYQKFFEVGLDDRLEPTPIDEIWEGSIADRNRMIDNKDAESYPYYRDTIVKHPVYVVPCVYIHQAVFLQKTLNTKELAKKVLHLLDWHLLEYNYPAASRLIEFQIDCDWPAKGQGAYFDFLIALKKEMRNSIKYAHILLSATLRLYPYKFPDQMGILPVDRAMLMCYNLQPPDHRGQKRSIFSLKVLHDYLVGARVYPVALDIALPIFNLAYVYDEHLFQKMLHNVDKDFKGILHHDNGYWFTLQKDTLIYDYPKDNFLRKGQRVKLEEVSLKELKKALKLIDQNVVFRDRPTLSFYSIENLPNANTATLKGLDRLYRTRP
jgi:hypothetical protein